MGPATSIFGRGALNESRLAEIDAFLAAQASSITRTRKGRVWSLQIQDRPVDVSVVNTAEVLRDCEDDLLAAGLLPEDAPFVVCLSAGMNQAADYELLRNLARQIAEIIGGPFTEPTK